MKVKKGLLVFAAMLLALALGACGLAAANQEPASVESVASLPASLPEPEPEPEPEEEPPVITVRYLEGQVEYLRGGEAAPLTAGSLLYQGDEISTHEDGMAVLKLDEDKQVQLAPGSRVEIAGFERGAGGDKTLLLLHQGNLINLLDAPLGDTDSYQVETPNLVMAIRGTIASVSCDAAGEESRVLLFEGTGAVTGKGLGGLAEIVAGSQARVAGSQLEQGAFTGAGLTPNEYWFLYQADHSALFDEPGLSIAERLEPLLNARDYQQEASAAGLTGGGSGAGGAAPGQGQSGTAAGGGTGQGQGDAQPAPPAGSDPPAETTPPPAEPEPGNGGGGMDEATFRAIEQEFLQAKEDYNNGLIGKDTFLAVKQKYIEAKKLYYGS